MACTCEMGFFPYHLQENCRANDHPTIHLPYNCSIDHYLDPAALEISPYMHRERSFLSNPRTPRAMLQTSRAVVQVGGGGGGGSSSSGSGGGGSSGSGSGGGGGGDSEAVRHDLLPREQKLVIYGLQVPRRAT